MVTTSLLTELNEKYPVVKWKLDQLTDGTNFLIGKIPGVLYMDIEVYYHLERDVKRWAVYLNASGAEIKVFENDPNHSIDLALKLFFQSRMARFLYDGKKGYDSWMQSIQQVLSEHSV